MNKDNLIGNKARMWAEYAAKGIIDEFDDAAAIDTAGYIPCGFFMAAAKLAVENPEVARMIGERMEPPRKNVRFSDIPDELL